MGVAMSIWSSVYELEFEQHWVDADGVGTRVVIAGSGPDVICLHGTSGHLEAFSRNVAALVRAGFRVHALDMLGHGLTDKPDFDYTPDRHSAHLRAYIRSQSLDRPHLIGESLGGWVATWFASEFPGEVGHVILVAPGGTRANPEVMERIKSATEAAVLTPSLERTRQRLEMLMFDKGQVTDELVEVRHAIYTKPAFAAALSHILCLQTLETRVRYLLDADRMAKVTTSVLLIWGRQNPFGKLAEADFIARSIPTCDLHIFENCGHWPQWEHNEQFNKLALEFLPSDAMPKK
jgi:2-hydroxy-6-oxonona-2,4-dienedioate hydrolase